MAINFFPEAAGASVAAGAGASVAAGAGASVTAGAAGASVVGTGVGWAQAPKITDSRTKMLMMVAHLF